MPKVTRVKQSDEFKKFDIAMEELLKVPHSDIKKKLEEEKAAKAEKKRKKKKTEQGIKS